MPVLRAAAFGHVMWDTQIKASVAANPTERGYDSRKEKLGTLAKGVGTWEHKKVILLPNSTAGPTTFLPTFP